MYTPNNSSIPLLLVFASMIATSSLMAQVQVEETKNWCQLTCEYTDEEQLDAELLFLRLQDESIKNNDSDKSLSLIHI